MGWGDDLYELTKESFEQHARDIAEDIHEYAKINTYEYQDNVENPEESVEDLTKCLLTGHVDSLLSALALDSTEWMSGMHDRRSSDEDREYYGQLYNYCSRIINGVREHLGEWLCFEMAKVYREVGFLENDLEEADAVNRLYRNLSGDYRKFEKEFRRFIYVVEDVSEYKEKVELYYFAKREADHFFKGKREIEELAL